jgi:hypothetical protein
MSGQRLGRSAFRSTHWIRRTGDIDLEAFKGGADALCWMKGVTRRTSSTDRCHSPLYVFLLAFLNRMRAGPMIIPGVLHFHALQENQMKPLERRQ